MTTQAFIEQALALPLEERIGLAEALWESISQSLPISDPRETVELAARRAAELIDGTVKGRSHDEVMSAARRALGCD
jgi:putative addiction module component (TIGR02574 family)